MEKKEDNSVYKAKGVPLSEKELKEHLEAFEVMNHLFDKNTNTVAKKS